MKHRVMILLSLTGIFLLAILISACRPEAGSNLVQPTATSTSQPMSTVTMASMGSVISARLPPCQFTQDVSVTVPALQTTSLDRYILSEPTVVMTSSKDVSTLHVLQWLPDNRRLLIKRFF
jgi:hypothetical protein